MRIANANGKDREKYYTMMTMHCNDDDKEQTHNMANRFRNCASLFILATWTLGNHVAPEKEVLKVMIIMMMTETHLIALIGKNLPLPVLLLMFM